MNENSNCIRQLLEQLKSEQLPQIDFDHLSERLADAAALLDKADTAVATAKLLRDDYQVRISGMLKGIAAADRKQSGAQDALRLVEQLPTLSGEQLIACYRHTAARFRDTFPTSFGYLTTSSKPRTETLAHYKS